MGEDRERNEGGRFVPEHTDEDVLNAVREHEPAGTKEVADQLGIARQSADYRLRRLLDEGQVSKKKVGNSLVWSAEED
ncbi:MULTISPECIES: winged helix-turn-helix domain-containing protein [unclassified Natrinema]|uniref:winged helix-turn-helix domain-containing protein n=1 Tax=unclassified Natrinema TaxID=2622230 RepID=UPI00067822C5|nr:MULTISPECIES: winged helix-turn-helix domain-containing protein [unclassified Natrinema]